MDRKDARDIYSVIQDSFDIKEVDIRTYSPLALAFMGDCVFDLIIRSIVVGEGNRQASKLHNKKSQIVKAATQASMADAIEGGLLEDEADVYRRGKNAHTMSKAKNATDMDYHKATGFEALLGYLYLTHKQDRIMELVKEALSRTDGGRYEI